MKLKEQGEILMPVGEPAIEHPEEYRAEIEELEELDEEDGLTDTGLPRPLDTYKPRDRPDVPEKRLPVPWNQSSAWGAIEPVREARCIVNSYCQVCGLVVEEGVVIVCPNKGSRIKPAYFHQDLGVNFTIVDNAPLHERCAKLAFAHCPDLREDPQNRKYRLRPYRRFRGERPAIMGA